MCGAGRGEVEPTSSRSGAPPAARSDRRELAKYHRRTKPPTRTYASAFVRACTQPHRETYRHVVLRRAVPAAGIGDQAAGPVARLSTDEQRTLEAAVLASLAEVRARARRRLGTGLPGDYGAAHGIARGVVGEGAPPRGQGGEQWGSGTGPAGHAGSGSPGAAGLPTDRHLVAVRRTAVSVYGCVETDRTVSTCYLYSVYVTSMLYPYVGLIFIL
jgi:hypothetical protein